MKNTAIKFHQKAQIIQPKSSKIVSNFLEKNNLHKKEFAQMIGVTLSYVYNLIDENVPFSTRSTTLERIAVVADIEPEEFCEYQISSDVVSYSENVLKLKEFIKKNKFTTLDFLKKIERKKRLEMVDILRGAKPLWIDYSALKHISEILNMTKDEFFDLWKNQMCEYLKEGGFNYAQNGEIIDIMFECAYQNMK